MKNYDFLIVGSGITGSVFAHEALKKGKKCLVIDKRNHVGGNCYCREIEGINVHLYGAHIFHTSNKEVWNYINELVEFNRYTNSPIINYKGEIYNLPFNMNTFNKLWNVVTPQEAKKIIESQKREFKVEKPKNLEEQAISLVGKDIYEKLIKGYTEKQWGRNCKDLPAFLIKRLPVRFTYDNNYFNDLYQGIPIGGYNNIFEKLLSGVEVKLENDFFKNRKEFERIADKILYTGPVDAFYNYKYGPLEYRSLRFEHEIVEVVNYQGNAVVNYTEKDIPYTRIIEHKHFEFGKQEKTVITKEYPEEWKIGKEAFYPINDKKNSDLLSKYNKLALKEKKVIFAGRLAEYRYYDMHHAFSNILKISKKEFNL